MEIQRCFRVRLRFQPRLIKQCSTGFPVLRLESLKVAFQRCTLFSARFLALTTSRLPSMPSFLPLLSSVETCFARTAWSERKFQNLAKNCAKFVHAHSRKPHHNILCKLCRCTAQILHNFSTFSDAPAHLSHKFSGICRECPAHKFCTIFLGTWPVLKIWLCTGNECLNSSASLLRELKWAITSPKKGQAIQRCHEEQSARSKGARLSPLD